MSDLPTYELERIFDAPRHLVWKAWTDPALVQRWYGPNVETHIHEMDLRAGGLWRVEMRWPNGGHFERIEYTEISEPERLVWLQSMSNADWEVASNPMMPDWPKVLLTTITFADEGPQTRLCLTWVPHEATQAEIDCFAAAMGGADKGWASGMDQLAELLAELQSA